MPQSPRPRPLRTGQEAALLVPGGVDEDRLAFLPPTTGPVIEGGESARMPPQKDEGDVAEYRRPSRRRAGAGSATARSRRSAPLPDLRPSIVPSCFSRSARTAAAETASGRADVTGGGDDRQRRRLGAPARVRGRTNAGRGADPRCCRPCIQGRARALSEISRGTCRRLRAVQAARRTQGLYQGRSVGRRDPGFAPAPTSRAAILLAVRASDTALPSDRDRRHNGCGPDRAQRLTSSSGARPARARAPPTAWQPGVSRRRSILEGLQPVGLRRGGGGQEEGG